MRGLRCRFFRDFREREVPQLRQEIQEPHGGRGVVDAQQLLPALRSIDGGVDARLQCIEAQLFGLADAEPA